MGFARFLYFCPLQNTTIMTKKLFFLFLFVATAMLGQAQVSKMIGQWNTYDDKTGDLRSTVKIYEENGFEPTIMPAGLRGTYHVTELAGAKMVFSVAPKIQKMLSDANPDKTERINIPIDKKVISRLMTMPVLPT